MIYLRLSGGLGNQLFQLAAAALLSDSGCKPQFVTPILEGLLSYNVPREPDSLKVLCRNGWLLDPVPRVSEPWRSLSLKARAGRWMPVLGISDRNFWKAIAHGVSGPYILDGYFQQGWSSDSFSRALSLMQMNSVLPSASLSVSEEEVIIHIRGGDFLKLKQFQVVGFEYYILAMQLALDRGYKYFVVISDDMHYADLIFNKIRKKIPTASIRFLNNGSSALLDFDIIRQAPARIIGNSTFAWWASALGKSDSPTWVPTLLSLGKARDFFLPFEIPLKQFQLEK